MLKYTSEILHIITYTVQTADSVVGGTVFSLWWANSGWLGCLNYSQLGRSQAIMEREAHPHFRCHKQPRPITQFRLRAE